MSRPATAQRLDALERQAGVVKPVRPPPCGFRPRPYQGHWLKALEHPRARVYVVAHRRSGKDLTGLYHIRRTALQRPGVYWHCLPTYSQARKAVWNSFTKDGRRVIDMFFPSELLTVNGRNAQQMSLTLRNGAIVQLVGSDNIDRLVGAGPVGVVFSEAALSKPNSWDLVRPILQENHGWALFISTPRGRNWFHKAYETAKVLQAEAPDLGYFADLQDIYSTKALPLSVLEEERRAGMPEALVRQEYLCDFSAALVGSIYGDLIEILEHQGRLSVADLPDDSPGELFASFDLGMDDSTAIWVWRVGPANVDFLAHYESHGQPMSHYFGVLDRWEREYGRKFSFIDLPHDARNRTLTTGTSPAEQTWSKYPGKVRLVPRASVPNGVQAARALLQEPGLRFHSRCAAGVEALRNYRRTWDEDLKAYSQQPVHDWSSHTADAFRYAAVMFQGTRRVVTVARERAERKEAARTRAVSTNRMTLDELWKDREDAIRRGEIRPVVRRQ